MRTGWLVAMLGAVAVLAGCTDRDEAAKAKVAEAKAVIAAVDVAAPYKDKLAAYEKAAAMLDDVAKRFSSTTVSQALAKGEAVDGLTVAEVTAGVTLLKPRAAKEAQAKAGLLGYVDEAALIKSFFVQDGECREEINRVQCLGYATLVSVRAVAKGDAVDAVVIDFRKGDDMQPMQAFLSGFLPLYKVERTKFDALLQSIASGLESSFTVDGLKLSGMRVGSDPLRPEYRVVLRAAGDAAADVATPVAAKGM